MFGNNPAGFIDHLGPTVLAAHLDALPLEVHDDPQCRVDAAQLIEAEVSDAFA